MSSGKYILDSCGEPINEPDIMKWAKWFDSSDRIVKQETINGIKVSTVFLSIDHGWGRQEPILWETMCFGGSMDNDCERCGGSREQAEAMHARMVDKVRSLNV